MKARIALLALVAACRTASGVDDSAPPAATPGGGDPNAPADSGAPTRNEPPVVRFVTEGIVVDTYAGSSERGNHDDIGTAATFDNPVGLALLGNGDLLVTEYEGAQVRRVTAARATSRVVGGFRDPFAILLAADGTVYVQTDRNPAGEKTELSGSLWRLQDGVPELLVTGMNRPRGLTQQQDGRLALADRERNVLYTFDPASRTLSPLAGSGRRGLFDGVAAVAEFNEPYGMATLPDGSLVVADRGNHCIRQILPNGDVYRYAGDGNPGMRDDDDRLLARFDLPIDVATDTLGNVYVSDEGNRRIRVITTSGAVRSIAGDGVQGFADGPAAAARFYGQEQLIATADGKTLYVSDGNKGELTPSYHRVRRITLP